MPYLPRSTVAETASAEPRSLEGDDEVASGKPRSSGPQLVADLVTLTKPRITVMVVATMLGGIWLAGRAAQAAGQPTPSGATMALSVIGTVVVVASANALNMYLERDTDRFMARTRERPLPAGRLDPRIALGFGLALAAVSVPLLTFAVNALTGLFAAIALTSYVLAYTPLKRKSPISLLVGAVPGAIPPLLGWTTVANTVSWPALLLFGVMFLWQVPHFLAIATFRRDDYAAAGLMVLPVAKGDAVTRRHIVVYTVALVAATLLLPRTGVGGPLYVAAAIGLGAVFFGFGAWGLRASAGVRWARGLFATSILYLVLLLAALVVSPGGSNDPAVAVAEQASQSLDRSSHGPEGP